MMDQTQPDRFRFFAFNKLNARISPVPGDICQGPTAALILYLL